MEREWEHLMDQSFVLKHYGRLSLMEQSGMTAEERAWWIKRLDAENKKLQDAGKQTPGDPGLPSTS